MATNPILAEDTHPLLTLIEAGGVNDLPVAMSLATMSDDARPDEDKRFALQVAIVLVKAAGYRVIKSRQRQYRRKGKNKDRVGPTFVARFADGEITRMSIFSSLEALDWERGLRLSQAAYESRWWTRVRVHGVPPLSALPPIVSAHFERDGVVLAQREIGSVP